MTTSTPAAAPAPADEGWSAPVRIGGITYTARIPVSYRPDRAAVLGAEFPDSLAAALLGHVAAQLMTPEGSAEGATYRAVGVLLDEADRDAIMLRLSGVGEPLTVGLLCAGMLEAVKALALVSPRPSILGGGESSTVVEIAGRPYTATVAEPLAGMPAAAVAGRAVPGPDVARLMELIDACGPQAAPAGGPRMLGLLLFSDADLHELDARVREDADPCTVEDIAAGVHLALERLADAGPGPFNFAGVSLGHQIDAMVSALEFAERTSPVVLTVGGADYRVGWPPVWASFVEAVAAIGPLAVPREGVGEAERLERLAAVVATALPMVLSAVDVEALAAQIDDRADPLDVWAVAEALSRTLLALDAEARPNVARVRQERAGLGGGEAGT